MNYGTAEQEIADRLNGKFAENGIANLYEAAPMPENEKDAKAWYNKIEVARAAVQYIDSFYEPDKGLDKAYIEERAKFRVTLESRKLRGDGGIYTLIELVKLYLIGFKPSNADRLTVVKYALLQVDENSVQPYLEFECKTLNAELSGEDTEPVLSPGATFTQISFAEQFSN